jgi:hypothetical protein
MMEMHSAVVFFDGDRAYKLKKPVNLGFVDFSTPEARAAACQREAEPNRRFAPDVYLGVMEVFDSARMTRVTMLRCTTHPSCDNGRQPELAHQRHPGSVTPVPARPRRQNLAIMASTQAAARQRQRGKHISLVLR